MCLRDHGMPSDEASVEPMSFPKHAGSSAINPPPVKREPIILADFVRFTAAFMVMVFHLFLQSWFNPSGEIARTSGSPFEFSWAPPVAWFGWVGVQIFFVLSGFVIAMSVRGVAMDFFRRRFLRVYPAAWVCLIISLAITYLALGYEPSLTERTIKSALLWPKGPYISGVYWTLPVELAFYLFVGLIMWRLGNDAVPYAALCLIGWSGLYWFLRFFGLISFIPEWLANVLLLTYGGCFALGVILWRIASGERRLLFYAALLAAFAVSIISLLPKSIANGELHGQPFLVPVVVFTISVIILAVGVRLNLMFLRILGRKLAREMGLMTYPLYLLHPTVGAIVLWGCAAFGFSALISLTIACLLSIIASFAVSRFFEPRTREAVSQLMDRTMFLIGSMSKQRAN